MLDVKIAKDAHTDESYSIKELFEQFYEEGDRVYVHELNSIYINIADYINTKKIFVIEDCDIKYNELQEICIKHMKIHNRNYNISKLLDT